MLPRKIYEVLAKSVCKMWQGRLGLVTRAGAPLQHRERGHYSKYGD